MPLFNRNHLFDPQSPDKEIAVNDEQGQALARGSPIGGAGLSQRIRNARSRGARNQGHGSTMSLDNAEAVNLPMNTAFLDTGPSDVPYGARGRDPGGWPKVIPAGMPPAVFGEPRRMQVPKELLIPSLPTNYYQLLGVAIPANSGDIIDQDMAFPIGTMYLDNYSSVWVYADGPGHWIPPASFGWVLPCYRKSSKIHIVAAGPPGQTQPALTAGGCISVIVTESVQPFSPGYALSDSGIGTAPAVSITGQVVVTPVQQGFLNGAFVVGPQPGSALPSETSTATAVGAAITASVPAVAARVSYITGFDVTLGVAAVLTTVTVTVTGITNQLNYVIVATAGQTDELSIRFPVPIPSTTFNTAIVVSLPAVGGGAAVNAVCAYGFQF